MAVRFTKRATESIDYGFDFSDILPSGDSLQSSTGTSSVTVASGLTAGTKTHNTSTGVVSQYLSGGTAGTAYTVTCTVTTTVGRILTREITILIASYPGVSVEEIQDMIETDLNQDRIQGLIEDAEADVVARFGEATSHVDYLRGGSSHLFPSRPVSSITSIVETISETNTTLSSNDYSLISNGWQIKRLSSGTNGATVWAPEVTLTFVPVDDSVRRKRVTVDLVKLAIQFSGLKSVRDGDHSEDGLDYQQQRESILSGLRPRQRVFA